MLTRDQLHDYQRTGVEHMHTHKDSMLWMGMGLGKTITTLTAIVDKINSGQIKKVLIFGPVRVISSVWEAEARKWEHTKHLTFSIVHGTAVKRSRAMFAEADIHLCNYENMNWLCEQLLHFYVDQGQPLPYQMCVYDEVSRVKNSTSMRVAGGHRDKEDANGHPYKVKMHGWRKMINMFQYRAGLTGTPASNGYLDLFGQFLVVDGGERLGEYVTHYKNSYFESDYMGWGSAVTPSGKEHIEKRISDIVLKMDTKDYLDMPEVTTINRMVDLPKKARKAYDQMEANMFAALENGTELEVFSKSAVSNKCLQMCLAEGTEVLTDSGWKPIETFTPGDKVWDGEEWVNVYELAFQGVKEVVELDGVWMTTDHKVLTASGWQQAEDVLDGYASERFDRVAVRLPDCIRADGVHCRRVEACPVACTMYLREGADRHRDESQEPQPARSEELRVQEGGGTGGVTRHPRDGAYTPVRRVAEHEVSVQEPEGQGLPELRGSWDRSLRRMVRFVQSILGRHGRGLSVTSSPRTGEQQRALQQEQLSMGHAESAIKQPAKQHLHTNAARSDDGHTSSTPVRVQGRDAVREDSQRVARGKPTATVKIEKTYDLINAGKRNRFTVRGKNGEIFLAHNCNGSPYLSPESPEFETLHRAKLDALGEVLEDAAGQPVLCSYTFKADAERIMKKFKKYRPVNLTAESASMTGDIIKRWNEGKIKLLIGHPASMGHGVDGLQKSGNILVWFGLPWSLELHDQMNARLNRQGQDHPVSIIRILCNDTVDLAVADAIARKTDDERGLKDALQRYRKGVTTNELEVSFL